MFINPVYSPIPKKQNIHFQNALIIRTTKPRILNQLYDLSYFNKEAPFYYEHIGITADKEGFWRGMLVNGKELKMNLSRVEEKAKVIKISTAKEFRETKKVIKRLFNIS
jgi:hypothetical protein